MNEVSPHPGAHAAGRLEFASYLPPNCQAALVQPVGPAGVLVLGGDTQRGFSRLDQVRLRPDVRLLSSTEQ